MSNRRGNLIIVVLALIAVILALIVGLMSQGSALNMLLRRELDIVSAQEQSDDVAARLGLALYDPDGTPGAELQQALGNVTSTGRFSSGEMNVSWGRDSLRFDVLPQGSTYNNLFANLLNVRPDAPPNSDVVYNAGDGYDQLPFVGYSVTNTTAYGVPVVPGHAAVTLESGGAPDLVVYNRFFPFALYAPQGTVKADSVLSWVNPTLTEADGDFKSDDAQSSGLPAWVGGRSSVTVANFPCGKAYSELGPMKVGGGAISLRQGPLPAGYCTALEGQIRTAMDRLSAGCIDKGRFLAGKFLTSDGVLKLFTGDGSAILKVFTVQQAMEFPFIPYFCYQQDEVVALLAIYTPAAADFSGDPVDQDKVQELSTLLQTIHDRQGKIDADSATFTAASANITADNTVINSTSSSQADKDKANADLPVQQKLYDQAHGDWVTLSEQQKQDKASAQRLQNEISSEQGDIHKAQEGAVPQTAYEDQTATTGSGWSYAYAFDTLGDFIKNLVSFNLGAAVTAGVRDVRLVHFGELAPEWTFSSDGTQVTMSGTWTVPAGKTLAISGSNTTIAGDLWIQRGATVHVPGNLEVARPSEWQDVAGVEEDFNTNPGAGSLQPTGVSDDSPFYPGGRVILEQGATLVVDGNLTVSGGSTRDGGILVCSRYDCPPRACNTAVLVGGDLEVDYGVYSAGTMLDLVWYAARNDATLKGFYTGFLAPLISYVAPAAAHVVGPWNARDPSYFARYAATFVQLELLNDILPGLGEVPIPIPLPVDNCLKYVMERFSRAVSLELNFNLGENLYPQCMWWLLGRGAVPVMLKVPPGDVGAAFSNINYVTLTIDTFSNVMLDFIQNVIPTIISTVVNDFIINTFENILKSEIPFNWPTCYGHDSEDPSKITWEKVGEEFEKVLADDVKKKVRQAFSNFIVTIRDALINHMGSNTDDDYLCKEMPGVLVYAGGKMTIGVTDFTDQAAITASGFFFAHGDVNIGAKRIVGSVVSATGNINTTGQVDYYPFFNRVSLYNPPKPASYAASALGIDIANAVQFVPPDPGGNTAIDLGPAGVRVTAQGWAR